MRMGYEQGIEGDCNSMVDVGNARAFASRSIHGPERPRRSRKPETGD